MTHEDSTIVARAFNVAKAAADQVHWATAIVAIAAGDSLEVAHEKGRMAAEAVLAPAKKAYDAAGKARLAVIERNAA